MNSFEDLNVAPNIDTDLPSPSVSTPPPVATGLESHPNSEPSNSVASIDTANSSEANMSTAETTTSLDDLSGPSSSLMTAAPGPTETDSSNTQTLSPAPSSGTLQETSIGGSRPSSPAKSPPVKTEEEVKAEEKAKEELSETALTLLRTTIQYFDLHALAQKLNQHINHFNQEILAVQTEQKRQEDCKYNEATKPLTQVNKQLEDNNEKIRKIGLNIGKNEKEIQKHNDESTKTLPSMKHKDIPAKMSNLWGMTNISFSSKPKDEKVEEERKNKELLDYRMKRNKELTDLITSLQAKNDKLSKEKTTIEANNVGLMSDKGKLEEKGKAWDETINQTKLKIQGLQTTIDPWKLILISLNVYDTNKNKFSASYQNFITKFELAKPCMTMSDFQDFVKMLDQDLPAFEFIHRIEDLLGIATQAALMTPEKRSEIQSFGLTFNEANAATPTPFAELAKTINTSIHDYSKDFFPIFEKQIHEQLISDQIRRQEQAEIDAQRLKKEKEESARKQQEEQKKRQEELRRINEEKARQAELEAQRVKEEKRILAEEKARQDAEIQKQVAEVKRQALLENNCKLAITKACKIGLSSIQNEYKGSDGNYDFIVVKNIKVEAYTKAKEAVFTEALKLNVDKDDIVKLLNELDAFINLAPSETSEIEGLHLHCLKIYNAPEQESLRKALYEYLSALIAKNLMIYFAVDPAVLQVENERLKNHRHTIREELIHAEFDKTDAAASEIEKNQNRIGGHKLREARATIGLDEIESGNILFDTSFLNQIQIDLLTKYKEHFEQYTKQLAKCRKELSIETVFEQEILKLVAELNKHPSKRAQRFAKTLIKNCLENKSEGIVHLSTDGISNLIKQIIIKKDDDNILDTPPQALLLCRNIMDLCIIHSQQKKMLGIDRVPSSLRVNDYKAQLEKIEQSILEEIETAKRLEIERAEKAKVEAERQKLFEEKRAEDERIRREEMERLKAIKTKEEEDALFQLLNQIQKPSEVLSHAKKSAPKTGTESSSTAPSPIPSTPPQSTTGTQQTLEVNPPKSNLLDDGQVPTSASDLETSKTSSLDSSYDSNTNSPRHSPSGPVSNKETKDSLPNDINLSGTSTQQSTPPARQGTNPFDDYAALGSVPFSDSSPFLLRGYGHTQPNDGFDDSNHEDSFHSDRSQTVGPNDNHLSSTKQMPSQTGDRDNSPETTPSSTMQYNAPPIDNSNLYLCKFYSLIINLLYKETVIAFLDKNVSYKLLGGGIALKDTVPERYYEGLKGNLKNPRTAEGVGRIFKELLSNKDRVPNQSSREVEQIRIAKAIIEIAKEKVKGPEGFVSNLLTCCGCFKNIGRTQATKALYQCISEVDPDQFGQQELQAFETKLNVFKQMIPGLTKPITDKTNDLKTR